MSDFVLRGDIIHTPELGKTEFFEDSFLVCRDGFCQGVYITLPQEYEHLPLHDYSGKLIIPGYSDLHTHASQYADLGLGMDYELIQWLDDLTFPEEARFADTEFAKEIYQRFADELRAGFTTRAVIYATVHAPATLELMRILESSGLVTLVGKVNMDRNCPDYLREKDADASIEETMRWLEGCREFRNTKPVITPRFVPSCTQQLLARLGEITARYGLYVQSHLDETHAEIAWVRELCPENSSYTDVYDSAGLLTEKTVMAHCLYNTDEETETLKSRGVFIAHCPSSNSNIKSGIAPVRSYLNRGLHVGLGTDISGGDSLDMSEEMRRALRVSKLRARLMDEPDAALGCDDVFYLATRGGGEFFGRVGAFCSGFEFDAVVVDEGRYRFPRENTMRERLEKLVHLSRSQDVCAKFIRGERIF